MKTPISSHSISNHTSSKFYCLLILLIFSSCTDDDFEVEDPCPGELPCIRKNASDEFIAAYANGEPWISRSDASFAGLHEIEANYNPISNVLSIRGRREYDEFSDNIGFATNDFTLDSLMELNLENLENYRDYNSRCLEQPNGSYGYYGDTTYQNSLTLSHFDLDTQIAEGEFTLRVVNPTCNDTITFEQGRFSIHFWIQ